MLLFLLLFTSNAWAQITDASFFPSMKSINPGVVHLRQGGFIAADYGKKSIRKNHEVPLHGIVGGINTDVDLTKKTLFGAAAYSFMSAEVLVDQENGVRKESINSTTLGSRTSEDKASSTYFGGLFDFNFLGVSYSRANYNYLNQFRVGDPPDLTAHDEKTELTYTNLKIGTVLKISFLRIGGYFLDQSGKGKLDYTYYDPNSGAQGSTEESPVTTSAKGYGAGVGLTFPSFRSEVSYESMYANKITVNDSYPGDVHPQTDSSRISAVAECKLWFFMVGARVRSIQGNYRDLEDIISSSLLYDKLTANDRRMETTFNFSLGDSKGLSPSAFYTQSKVVSQELSPVFDNGLTYRAVTTSKAYGVNLSFRF